MNVSMLPVGADLVEEVARQVAAEGPDCSGSLVIFPGKRPAHFLRRRLALGRTSSFLPPRILSMDELVDEVFATRDARAGRVRPALEPIDAVAILHDLQLAAHAGALGSLGGNAFMTLDSFFPIGLKLYSDLEELFIEGVEARRVAEVQPLVEEAVPPRSRERLRSLAHFFDAFYPAVSVRGLSTRSMRYRAVSQEIEPGDLPGAGLAIFAGFFALSRSEQALFRAVGAWPNARFVFQDGPGLRTRLEGFGVPLPPSAREEKPPRADCRFYASPDTHGQVFALNEALGSPDDRTLVVLPDPQTLFPLLRHCLSRLEPEEFNVSLGYPLLRTPLYGFLNSLMELVGSMDGERVYLPAYVAFVLHPYVKNIRLGASAESTRVLLHALEERLAEARTRRFATLEEIEGDEKLFEEAAARIAAEDRSTMASALRAHLSDIHRRTVGSFRSFASVRDFADRCIGLVAWVHEKSTARDHPYFTPFSESFVGSLDAIARSLLSPKSFNDAASYFLLFRRYLQTRYHPFMGTPLHGLQVLGALETRNLRFDRVFVLDANEGTLPGTGAEASLLPYAVRAALGLSTYRDQEDISAYHFELLAAGARELHLFSITGGDKERSRFVERLLWDRQKAEGAFEETGIVRSIQYRVTLTNRPPEPIGKTGEVADWLRIRQHSATSLDAWLKCPLKFYYSNVLSLGQRDEPAADIEARAIGTFVHGVLYRYFSTRKGRKLSGMDADPAAMAAIVEELFPEQFGFAVSGANRLLLHQVKTHLCDFADRYLRRLAAGHQVTIGALEHTVTAQSGGFALRGRIDVVEERDGRPCLVDYKTSANRAGYQVRLKKLVLEDRATWGTAIPTIQLPFYVLLHSADTIADPVDIQAMFLLLGRTELDEGIELPLFDDSAMAKDAWPLLSEVITRLLQEIVSPDVPFTPARDLKSACQWCDFTGICGTGWLTQG